MGLLDRFKKKKYIDEYQQTNETIRKRIVEKKLKPVDMTMVEEAMERIVATPLETIQDANNKNQTLYRIGILEEFSTWSATTLLSLQGDFQQFQLNTQQELKELRDLLNATREFKADVVLDTLDNTYKDVKKIVVDNAINANMIYDNILGRYVSINDFQFEKAKFAQEANKALLSKSSDEADIAKTIRYNGGVFSLDDILKDYISDKEWVSIIDSSNDFDTFKQELKKRIGRVA